MENSPCTEQPEIPVQTAVISVSNENDVGSLLSSDRESSNTSDNLALTREMVEIDGQLESEFLAEDQTLQEKVMEEARDRKWREQCFSRLKDLLNRSNMYAQFLVGRLDKHRALSENKVVAEDQRQKLKELQQPIITKQTAQAKGSSRQLKKQEKYENLNVQGNATECERSHKKRKLIQRKGEGVHLYDVFNKKNLQASLLKQEELEKSDAFSKTINGEKVSDRQPSLVSGGVMRSYQLDALDWLKVLYENGINGILADEMGLGKTLECIALIAYLIEKGMCGPYIVVCPLSTLHNWINEFRRFTPLIPTISYHGTKEERSVLRKKFDRKISVLNQRIHPVLVTSYAIAIRDRVHLWNYSWMITVDEAHRIKNYKCLLTRELKRYRSTNRLLLTGTPLQNNLSELWSLLNFLLPEVFNDLNVFESWFDITALSQGEGEEEIIAQEKEKKIISTIQQILSPFLLRRTKADVALELPPKKEVIVYAPFTTKQNELYTAVADNSIHNLLSAQAKHNVSSGIIEGKRRREVVDYRERGENDIPDLETVVNTSLEEKNAKSVENKKDSDVKRGSVINIKMNNVMMMLRKICNHPYLVEFPLTKTGDYLINENLIKCCGKLSVLDLMLRELKKRGHKVLIFSQFVIMLDILCYYCKLRGYAFNYLDGNVSLDDRQKEIDNFNSNPSSFLFLLSTRAGGLGINLTAADTVIIYDSDWNPQVDLQAQDRCHRLGQTKPVVIYRLVVAKTIDENIVDRACAKRKLEKMIIRKGRFASQDSMRTTDVITQNELLELLQSRDYSECVNIEDFVSREQLNMVLDRSDMLTSNGEHRPKIHSQSSIPSEIIGIFKVVQSVQ